MGIFKYDPLEVIDRADKSADEWWSKTLDNAQKRVKLDQYELDNARHNNFNERTHEGRVYGTNAYNRYSGAKNNILGEDFEQMMTPENREARRVYVNNAVQTPAAFLEARAAGAGIANIGDSMRAGADAARRYSGALGAQGDFMRAATGADNLSLASDLTIGNLEGANRKLQSVLPGMEIQQDPRDKTKVIIRNADGQSFSMPIAHAVAHVNDLTGQKAGNSQSYLDKQDGQRATYEQQIGLQRLRNDGKQAAIDERMRSAEGRNLVEAFKAAEKSGDKVMMEEAWNRLQQFQNDAGDEYDLGTTYRRGATFRPAGYGAPADSPSAGQSMIGGPKSAPAANSVHAAVATPNDRPAAYVPPAKPAATNNVDMDTKGVGPMNEGYFKTLLEQERRGDKMTPFMAQRLEQLKKMRDEYRRNVSIGSGNDNTYAMP